MCGIDGFRRVGRSGHERDETRGDADPATHGGPSVASWRRGGWQPEHEAGAGGGVLEHDVAVHSPGQLATNRQPQAEAAGFGVPASGEALEDALALLYRDARAIVRDGNAGLAVPARQ